MKNTVLVESKTRHKLKLVCALMCVFCICFIAVLVSVVMLSKQNLNGQTTEVTGILSEVYVEGTNTLTIDNDKYYNVVWDDKEVNIDFESYQGKTITLIVTRDTFASSNPWIFGLVVDGQTIVDYQDTLAQQTEYNNEIKTVLIAVTAVLCVATCGLFIWRFNLQPLVERELYKEFGEFLSTRQPSCPQRKALAWYLGSYCVLLLALLLTAILLDPQSETIEELSAAAQAVLWTLLAVGIVGGAGIFVLNEWITRKEINFYADKLPFDFSDISHAPLRKTVKEELQQEIRKEREEHPHTYADGGNGYDVTFDENGVTLTEPYDENEPNETQLAGMPDADAVFSDVAATESSVATTGDLNASASRTKLFLSYEELNFEAVAYYRKNIRPMMIIIKSRLIRQDSFPEELVNDVHIPLDLNLLNTLTTFNVKIENLDYLMQNKKQLMLENCLSLNKNKANITK